MSVSSRGRLYGGETAEERIAHRRRKLVEAGMNLFGSADSGSVRVKDVVAEAGLTERYFYESFSDLEALFDVAHELTMKALEEDVEKALANAPAEPVARISIAMRTIVDSLVADPRMIRIQFVEALGRGGRAGVRRNELYVRSAENYIKWSGPSPGSFMTSPAETRMKAVAVAGAVGELLISWAEGVLDLTPAELADFLIGMYWRISLP
ncbi:hypothetical protein NONO_c36130 [Nocardia nova SH22a]|uniref:HTH tetR-type domain-containing protein n=2 Tax=Nocardia nova TaxID=37330 RepID=W5TGF0_9NOCA|nr:hypothetical protein NONO_c36130 [Nocardia nova SH22a]